MSDWNIHNQVTMSRDWMVKIIIFYVLFIYFSVSVLFSHSTVLGDSEQNITRKMVE